MVPEIQRRNSRTFSRSQHIPTILRFTFISGHKEGLYKRGQTYTLYAAALLIISMTAKAIITFQSGATIDLPAPASFSDVVLNLSSNLKYKLKGETEYRTVPSDGFMTLESLQFTLMDKEGGLVFSKLAQGDISRDKSEPLRHYLKTNVYMRRM